MDTQAQAQPERREARCRNPLAELPSASRILVVRLGALGDVVRTLPAVAALRRGYPAAHIAWLVEPVAIPLLRTQSMIDEVIPFERAASLRELRSLALRPLGARSAALLRRLRSGFDLALDFHSILRSALLVRLCDARTRVGYAPPVAREGAHLCFTHRAELGGERRSRFERNAALVRFLGLPVPLVSRVSASADAFRLEASPQADERLRARIGGQESSAQARGFAVLHPGSSPKASYKQWPEASFARLARDLADARGLVSWVASGPADHERACAARIVEASGGAARLAPPTADTAELVALLARAQLFVGGDSGPLHIASLCGTPVVQLLGPTHPIENEPWPGTPWRRAHRPVPCSPCRRGCANPVCMSQLPPGDALRAALEVLDEAAQRSPAGAALAPARGGAR